MSSMNERHYLEPPTLHDEGPENELADRFESDADAWRKGEL